MEHEQADEIEAYVYATAGIRLAREYGLELELENTAERVRVRSLMAAHGMIDETDILGGEIDGENR